MERDYARMESFGFSQNDGRKGAQEICAENANAKLGGVSLKEVLKLKEKKKKLS